MSQNNDNTRRGPLAWLDAMARAFRREFTLIFSDMGVMIFFFLLPLGYPVLYTLIYNPEIVTDMPIAVVDNSRSPLSRRFVQTASASPAIKIEAQCSNMAEAKDLFAQNKVFAIMEIPRDFDRRIGRGETATVPMYFQMALLLRYRAFLSAISDIQLKTIGDITQAKLEATGLSALGMSEMPVDTQSTFLGDSGQGFASFIMPGVLMIILQQSLVLGICMLRGTSNERRRRNGGIDPRQIAGAPASASLLGKTACYFVIYCPILIYVLTILPDVFAFPRAGSPVDYFLFAVPYILASVMFGFFVSNWCTERESGFILVVFTSVIFLFLSGLTWPTYAMSPFWQGLCKCVPASLGVEGFIRINSNGASLAEVSHCYWGLWVQAAVYFMVSWAIALRVRAISQPRPAKIAA